jgi:hypothetical protein
MTLSRLQGSCVLAALLAAGSLAACTHIVKRPSQCAPPLPPAGGSALGWERVVGPPTISGHVLAPGSLSPLEGALVSVTLLPINPQGSSKTLQQGTDKSGAFLIESISPARYLMRIRRLGYRQAHDTVEVKRDSAIVATALLVRDNITLDDCSLTYTEVRVPWWKR